MSTLTRTERFTAMGAAVAFSGVTTWVLLEDLFRGAPVTVSHPLTVIAIVGAILGGLWSFRLLKARQWQTGVMLALLTVGATIYVGVQSMSRNAAAMATRAERFVTLQNDVLEARKTWEAIKADTAVECRKVGPQCKNKSALVDAAWSHVLIQEARRDAVGPVNSYAHAAATFAALSGMDAKRIESWLAAFMPLVLVLVAELGTVVFTHLAFSGGPTGGQRTTFVPEVPVIEEETRPNVVEFAKRFEAVNKRRPTVDEIAQACNLPRTTAWRLARKAA